MAYKPCRLCGNMLRVTPKSLPEPTCHSCRRGQRLARPPKPRISTKRPSIMCSGSCGRLLWASTTSAAQPKCLKCRRAERAAREAQKAAATRKRVRRVCRDCRNEFETERDYLRCGECRRRERERHRDRPNSARRGYGSEHQRRRREFLAAFSDGDPCARCGRPMRTGDPLDLDHTDDRTSYLGLSHAWCNRAKRATTPRAARHCAICGAGFRPSHKEQRSCSRACGVELRKLNAA